MGSSKNNDFLEGSWEDGSDGEQTGLKHRERKRARIRRRVERLLEQKHLRSIIADDFSQPLKSTRYCAGISSGEE